MSQLSHLINGFCPVILYLTAKKLKNSIKKAPCHKRDAR
nr:MAG TPA: hypothetical protein [Caudoviricetes sp.]